MEGKQRLQAVSVLFPPKYLEINKIDNKILKLTPNELTNDFNNPINETLSDIFTT